MPTRTALPTQTPVYGKALSVDPDSRTLQIIVSTPARDRQGDIVEPAGLDFSHYLENPVVLWAHDLARPPIGKIIQLEVGVSAVTATVEFADTPFAQEVFTLYAEGFLRAWSVGFLPREWERIDGEEPGFRILSAEVVEVSAVPVPANPETLTRTADKIQNKALREALLAPLAQDSSVSTPAADRETHARIPILTFMNCAGKALRTLTQKAVEDELQRQRGAVLS